MPAALRTYLCPIISMPMYSASSFASSRCLRTNSSIMPSSLMYRSSFCESHLGQPMGFVSETSPVNCHLSVIFVILSVILSVIFLTTKGLCGISGLIVLFKCPVDFFSTRPRLFINGYDAQFHCIKGKCHNRRHLFFSSCW